MSRPFSPSCAPKNFIQIDKCFESIIFQNFKHRTQPHYRIGEQKIVKTNPAVFKDPTCVICLDDIFYLMIIL